MPITVVFSDMPEPFAHAVEPAGDFRPRVWFELGGGEGGFEPGLWGVGMRALDGMEITEEDDGRWEMEVI